MPQTELMLFREEDGSVPVLQWLDELPMKARDKCIVRIERLAELGHELRRPEADFLRDGIHELRAVFQRVNYRMLYFFCGNRAVVVSHGLTKEKGVPQREIDTAIRNREIFLVNPTLHSFTGEADRG